MNIKHWNIIAQMVGDGDTGVYGQGGVEDIGRKIWHGQEVHEFIIDNELYRIVKVES